MKFFVAASILLLTVLTEAATTVTALQPFESTYKVTGRGALKAERTVSLSRENDHYVLVSTTEARGLASLAGYGPLVEISKFEIVFDRIRPLSYSNVDKSGMSGLNESIKFEWDNGIVKSKRNEQNFEFPLKETVLDPLTVRLSARLDLVNGLSQPIYHVHEVDQIRTYRISRLPDETIMVAERDFACIHLVVDTERPNRKLHYWMVPKLAYLPIQLKQFHDGNLEFTATLIESSFLP